MTGRMVSKYNGDCANCGGHWSAGDMIFFVEGDWKHYYCSESCARSVSVPVDAQTPSNPTYTAPTADIAVNAQETRSRAIHEAHVENMEANTQLCCAYDRLVTAIDLQTAVCDDLRAELAKIAKCMQDDYLARRGVKV